MAVLSYCGILGKTSSGRSSEFRPLIRQKKDSLTTEQLQAARAEKWRQKANPVLTLEDAETWIDSIGVSLFLPRKAQLQAPGLATIDCKLELDESLGTIAADPDLLHRAFSNLVLNAMDAMPDGGTLRLRSRGDDGKVIVEIVDTGSGLTPEECERIFTPYYTSKQHGTGLGLAIVQSVVSDHGGRISVQSEPERGTTFVIELPENLEALQETKA